ncbi:hypothetical protein PG997_011235, partial [Apiospora hydei]
MKTSTVVAVLAPSAASAQWWNGAPECAHTCLSSAYAAATSASSASGNSAPLLAGAVRLLQRKQGQPDLVLPGLRLQGHAHRRQQLRQAELLALLAVGRVHRRRLHGRPHRHPARRPRDLGRPPAAGAPTTTTTAPTAVRTTSAPTAATATSATATVRTAVAPTWTGGVVTVTGCMSDGSPWFAGPGCGWNAHGGFNGWVGWGNGWKWGTTEISTVTITTKDGNNNDALTTFTGLATVAAAISGDLTTSTTIGLATSTGSANGNGAARIGGSPVGGSEGSMVTGMMGIALGAVIVIAGM